MNDVARANAMAAEALIEELARSGVREACVAPGSRSTPLVLALSKEAGIRTWTITDERSAAFFALGMARVSGRPVAVVCTSGTAAANLSPAVAEASLSEIPLILITADRPPELRDCGAHQTIRQAGLFASHARWSADTPVPDGFADAEVYFRTIACRAVWIASAPPAGPVHLNVPFREPLLDPDAASSAQRMATGGRSDGRPWSIVDPTSTCATPAVLERIAHQLQSTPRGLIVCGPRIGARGDAAPVARLARMLGWPILADPLSGMRHGRHDRTNVVDGYDVFLRSDAFCVQHPPDVVLRFGGLPTSKPLQRYLQTAGPGHHLLVASPRTWPDPLFTTSEIIHAEAEAFSDTLAGLLSSRRAVGSAHTWLDEWRRSSAIIRESMDAALGSDAEMFEGRIPVEVTKLLPHGGILFIGNSMPVRDLDTFVPSCGKDIEVLGNRGASGIDGVVSTALGAAAVERRPAALIVGDLSFLHDVGGLQIAARHGLGLVVIVVNNDGGGIFSFLPQSRLGPTFEPYFATPHGLDLEPAVRMCKGRFARVTTWAEFDRAVGQGCSEPELTVVEVVTDRARNYERHEEIVAIALRRLRTAAEAAA